jgi:hypothetical protein
MTTYEEYAKSFYQNFNGTPEEGVYPMTREDWEKAVENDKKYSIGG